MAFKIVDKRKKEIKIIWLFIKNGFNTLAIKNSFSIDRTAWIINTFSCK